MGTGTWTRTRMWTGIGTGTGSWTGIGMDKDMDGDRDGDRNGERNGDTDMDRNRDRDGDRAVPRAVPLTQGPVLDGVAVLPALPGVGLGVEHGVELDLADLQRGPFEQRDLVVDGQTPVAGGGGGGGTAPPGLGMGGTPKNPPCAPSPDLKAGISLANLMTCWIMKVLRSAKCGSMEKTSGSTSSAPHSGCAPSPEGLGERGLGM